MRWKTVIYPIMILMIVLILAPEAITETQEEFHQTYTIKPDTEVIVRNVNGNIDISTWDKDHVDVYALKRTKYDQDELDRVSVEVNTDGIMEIRTEFKRHERGRDSFFSRTFGSFRPRSPRVSVDFNIKLPASVILSRANSVNGNVVLSDTIKQ